MHRGLSFDATMFPCAPGIALQQETLPSYTVFTFVGNKPPDIRLPKVLISADKVHLNQTFILTSSEFISLPVMTICRVPTLG